MKTLASLVVLGLMTSMPAPAESTWTFINDAIDGALYFGRNPRTFEGITFLQIKQEGDPDGGNGDENAWNQAFNCKNKTYRVDGEFQPIQKGKVNYRWFEFACKK